MKPLNELFDVTYGNKLDLNKMRIVAELSGGDRVNFVGRSSENHGVSAQVQVIPNLTPYDAGLITVALGGTKLLASFVQTQPFYTAQNVAVLRPKQQMTFGEKVYACLAIRHNRFRYSAFGREANRTLRTLEVPEIAEYPEWVRARDTTAYEGAAAIIGRAGTQSLGADEWQPFLLTELFEIRKGKRLTKAQMSPGTTPFVSAIDANNGVRQYVDAPPQHPANVLTVNYNGNGVADAYFQEAPFWASDDVNVLYPKQPLDLPVALFICTVIRREKYRFSYGRKWGLGRMKTSSIKLPADANGAPDWAFMRAFVSALPLFAETA